MRQARRRLYAGMVDHFQDSGAVQPGPYTSSAVEMCMILVEDKHPPPLPWNVMPLLPGSGRYFIVLTDYKNFSSTTTTTTYRYRELAYLVSVMTTLGPGFHSVRLFPDAVVPTAVGRELYAFPKTFGEVWLDSKGGGAAANGNLQFHAEWSPSGAVDLSEVVRQMADALLPTFPVNPVSWAAGALTGLVEPVLSTYGMPLRIYTERGGHNAPGSPLGHAEMVRAPFRFVISGTKELSLKGLHHATKPVLKGLGAWSFQVDMRLEESYAVNDRDNWLRTPWLRAQVPIRTLLELLS
ncbi:MAG: acetoacetate decarboxylase family protein [Proteobacteria bacterium]|nr:acetoacetate decarboxylase family protein [Pseudomonadota bacterium]MCP4915943.1 acetoacetate decarboxylase family protein [Pseudomonadota bacterium]